jgi:hypothetical protein
MSGTLEMTPTPIDSKERKPRSRFVESKVSPEHYKAEACVVWCFDARFTNSGSDFLKNQGFSESKIDLVKRAGGAKALAMEGSADQEDVLKQIAGSIKLHQTDRVILMVHMDCGAYGGSSAFENDNNKERDHHIAELKKATAAVHAKFPEIKVVESWIAGLSGVERVDEEESEGQAMGMAA